MLVLSITSSSVLLFLFIDSMIRKKKLLRFLLILVLPVASVIHLSLRLMTRASRLLFSWLLSRNSYVDSSHKLMKPVVLALA
jgi:hypothetical protein